MGEDKGRGGRKRGRREGGEAGAAAKATSSSSHDMTSKGRVRWVPIQKLDSCTNLSSARVSGMGNNMA